jgi:hypothetical protein
MPIIAREGHAASLRKRQKKARARATDLMPIIAEIRASGATSLQAVADGLNARGIPAARGGKWGRVQVQRVLIGAF